MVFDLNIVLVCCVQKEFFSLCYFFLSQDETLDSLMLFPVRAFSAQPSLENINGVTRHECFLKLTGIDVLGKQSEVLRITHVQMFRLLMGGPETIPSINERWCHNVPAEKSSWSEPVLFNHLLLMNSWPVLDILFPGWAAEQVLNMCMFLGCWKTQERSTEQVDLGIEHGTVINH